ncbi:MAG: hypothetical protein H7839_17585 [Magnetococcus sp. YQC-5]
MLNLFFLPKKQSIRKQFQDVVRIFVGIFAGNAIKKNLTDISCHILYITYLMKSAKGPFPCIAGFGRINITTIMTDWFREIPIPLLPLTTPVVCNNDRPNANHPMFCTRSQNPTFSPVSFHPFRIWQDWIKEITAAAQFIHFYFLNNRIIPQA